MPDPHTQNHLKLQYDDPDYKTLRLAATIEQAPNLKAWATETLLAHARRTVTEFKTPALTPAAKPEGGGS